MRDLDPDLEFFGVASLSDFDFFSRLLLLLANCRWLRCRWCVSRHPAASPYLLYDSVTLIWSGNDIAQTGVMALTVKMTLTLTLT